MCYCFLGLVTFAQRENINSNREYNIVFTQPIMKFQQDEGQYHGYNSRKKRLMRCLGYRPTCKSNKNVMHQIAGDI